MGDTSRWGKNFDVTAPTKNFFVPHSLLATHFITSSWVDTKLDAKIQNNNPINLTSSGTPSDVLQYISTLTKSRTKPSGMEDVDSIASNLIAPSRHSSSIVMKLSPAWTYMQVKTMYDASMIEIKLLYTDAVY